MIEIRCAVTPADLEAARALLRQYGAIPGVGECVVGFAAEIAGLPGRYAEPEGTLLLASLDGLVAGCGALRKLAPGVCEMKRLYVEPGTRGSSLGRTLAVSLVEAGRERGYKTMRLDTLPFMESAIALYRSLGFKEIDRYNAGSPANALYFELEL
jgi:ribosomal protein S18 acetylase RimI-like enzyme